MYLYDYRTRAVQQGEILERLRVQYYIIPNSLQPDLESMGGGNGEFQYEYSSEALTQRRTTHPRVVESVAVASAVTESDNAACAWCASW